MIGEDPRQLDRVARSKSLAPETLRGNFERGDDSSFKESTGQTGKEQLRLAKNRFSSRTDASADGLVGFAERDQPLSAVNLGHSFAPVRMPPPRPARTTPDK